MDTHYYDEKSSAEVIQHQEFDESVASAKVADYLGWSELRSDEHAAARAAIATAYLDQQWGATEAVNALVEYGLFADDITFMDIFAAGVAALAARVPPDLPPAPAVAMALPEQLMPNWDVLEVLAKVRVA